MSDMFSSRTRLDTIFKIMVIGAIGIFALVLVRDIVLPIVFAGIFSVVLTPIAKRVEKKTGRIFSIIIVLIGVFVVMSLVAWFVVAQLTSLVNNLPELETKYSDSVNNITSSLSEWFNISIAEQGKLLKDGLTSLSSVATELVASTGYLMYFIVQVPIYIFLFLLYREKLRMFFETLTPDGNMKWKSEMESVIRGYIAGLSIVVFIAGTLNSIGLLILGIDHAIFFGFLSGCLTVIPYVGITVGAALPAILALITKDSMWYAVGVVGVHAFVQFLEGNFITPKITGSRISINAMAAIFALLIGGKIWGIPGMILAVPAIGIVKILLSYSDSFKPLANLMGDSDEGKTEGIKPSDQQSTDESQST